MCTGAEPEVAAAAKGAGDVAAATEAGSALALEAGAENLVGTELGASLYSAGATPTGTPGLLQLADGTYVSAATGAPALPSESGVFIDSSTGLAVGDAGAAEMTAVATPGAENFINDSMLDASGVEGALKTVSGAPGVLDAVGTAAGVAKAVAPAVGAGMSLLGAGAGLQTAKIQAAAGKQAAGAVVAPPTAPTADSVAASGTQAAIDPDLTAIRKKNSLLFGLDSPASTDLTGGKSGTGNIGRTSLLGGTSKLGG